MGKNNYKMLIYFIIIFLSTIVLASLYLQTRNDNSERRQEEVSILGVNTIDNKNAQVDESSNNNSNSNPSQEIHNAIGEMKKSINLLHDFEDEIDMQIKNIDEVASLD